MKSIKVNFFVITNFCPGSPCYALKAILEEKSLEFRCRANGIDDFTQRYEKKRNCYPQVFCILAVLGISKTFRRKYKYWVLF